MNRGTVSAPRLVVVYGHRSLDAMALREAARGWCELIWLVDADDESATAVVPLLRRSGPVVPALGLPAEEAAAALRPHEPDGLVTFYDTGMEHVAAIAGELDLPSNSVQTALRLGDKYHQREALRAAGLPTPPVVALPAGADRATQKALISQVTYPAILKPRRASGSWHTFRVGDAGELRRRLAELEREPPEEMIVEGYLSDGPPMPGGFEAGYVSVETLIVEREITHLAITGRFPMVAPMRETGFFIPSTLDEPRSEEVLEVATAALRALDVRVGCAHTEIKLTAEGPQVIEVNGRIGGGVPEMLRLGAGLDLIQLTMRAALGLPPEVPSMPEITGVAYRFFFQPPSSACRLLAIDGLDEISHQPGVDGLYLKFAPGSELDPAHGTRNYIFAMVGLAADHSAVAAMSDYISQAVTAVYEHVPGTIRRFAPRPGVGPRPVRDRAVTADVGA